MKVWRKIVSCAAVDASLAKSLSIARVARKARAARALRASRNPRNQSRPINPVNPSRQGRAKRAARKRKANASWLQPSHPPRQRMLQLCHNIPVLLQHYRRPSHNIPQNSFRELQSTNNIHTWKISYQLFVPEESVVDSIYVVATTLYSYKV